MAAFLFGLLHKVPLTMSPSTERDEGRGKARCYSLFLTYFYLVILLWWGMGTSGGQRKTFESWFSPPTLGRQGLSCICSAVYSRLASKDLPLTFCSCFILLRWQNILTKGSLGKENVCFHLRCFSLQCFPYIVSLTVFQLAASTMEGRKVRTQAEAWSRSHRAALRMTQTQAHPASLENPGP